ncbi:MAG: hypothetical protein AB7Q29_05730 [Vicinamibacterales bacterium]
MSPPGPLSTGLPLLLLPIRIETRFNLVDKDHRELLVRIYPDHVHADAHVPELDPAEAVAGRAFWAKVWPVETPPEERERLFGEIAARAGAFRAAWILEATRPTNWSTRTAAQAPAFPAPSRRAGVNPAMARLLPDRWFVAGYQNEDFMFAASSTAIPRDLPLAPDFAASGAAPRDMADLLAAQGLEWLRDFDAAVKVGMAVRIPLQQPISVHYPTELIVVGIRTGEKAESTAAQLASLLAAHHWTHGADFVRRGTPTNNSDGVSSGVSLSEPDLAALLGTVIPAKTPTKGGPLFRRPFVDAAATAFGLDRDTILERVPLARDAQLDLGAAMNAALWPATIGHFLRRQIAGAVPDGWIDWLRGHFINHVRPGGPLPALRLGRHPYGVLPVAIEERHDNPAGRLESCENVLLDLLPTWVRAVGRVAHLDPDATDASGDQAANRDSLEDATTTLARVLGATPNPSDLMLRPVTDESDLYALRWGLLIFFLDIAVSPHFPDIANALGDDLAAATTIEDQVEAFERQVSQGGAGNPYPSGPLWLEAHLTSNDQTTRDTAQAAVDYIEDYILPLLHNHRDRATPLLDLGPNRTRVTGLMPDDAGPRLFFSLFGTDSERAAWSGPLVSVDPGGNDVRGWLEALLAEANGGPPAAAPGDHAPLLFQLLKRGISVVDDVDRADMIEGLATLAAAAADGRLRDVAGDLETLMGETLGACMYRLDAWLTAAASNRLADLRKATPAGLQVGAFGWVENLSARSHGPTQGFIHAPSLDHAASGAILRSGWSALGDGAAGVNVSSDRVRAAAWLIDGLRDGRSLVELLGQSLERRLHDAGLDAQTEPLRRAVLDATGAADTPATGIVDGLVVARAWIGGDEVAPLTADEQAVRTAIQGLAAATTALRQVFADHASDLDAVADATLAQAVHSLVRGEESKVSAALASGSGGAVPAELSALRTPRAGQRITHRIVLLYSARASAAAGASPDAMAEPSLEAWLSSLLPPLRHVVFTATITENEQTSSRTDTLDSAGLGVLELLDDLPEGVDLGSGRLARRLAWTIERAAAAAGRRVSVRIDGRPPSLDERQIPLDFFLVAAQRLRGALKGGRAADASDLSEAEVDSTIDLEALTTREQALTGRARADLDRLQRAIDGGSTADVLDSCAALASWHVAGAIPRSGLTDLASGGDPADRDALIVDARATLARFEARIAACDLVEGDDVPAVLARMRALLGPGAIVSPPFIAPDPAALAASAARSASRLGTPSAALDWLRQAGRVRPRVGDLAAAVDLIEAAAGGRGFDPLLVQWPDHAGETWAATTAPNVDTRPRVCVLLPAAPSLTPAPLPVAGLVVDGWTEVIPDREATTGVAVHFDAPSAKAPQAFLLAMPPREGEWSLDFVRAVVRQTLKRARQRAVGPEEIEGLGQFLPAIYLDDATDPGEQDPAVPA